jgi:hypothetical protein
MAGAEAVTRGRSVALVGLLVAVATLGASVPSSARDRITYVSPDCFRLGIRPTEILFACGDGAYYADHLNWRSWHPWKAVGFGVFHQNDCRPSCADGTFHRRAGRIALRKRTWCPRRHVYVYRRAHVRYVRRLLGDRTDSFRLLPPAHC